MPKSVIIKEVGPRDGLQNESAVVPTEDKVELIRRLSDSGLKHIEVSSFVNPKWIPALADASDVFAQIERKDGVLYSALVPNERGLERALTANVDAVNIFMSASESHNRKNINKSIEDTFPVLSPVVKSAKNQGLPVRGYVSTVFGCPYEGKVNIESVLNVSHRLLEMGIDELSLGDTIGVAVPSQVTEVIEKLTTEIPREKIALHFHATYGTAMANIWAGLNSGISIFDAAVGGLGGCPYAPGASGNVATEDVLYMLHRMGIETGVDESKILDTAAWLEKVIGRNVASNMRAVQRGAS
ncbi:hydroxymethylglutaryl-CoA lyase [Alicyclobacillus sp. SO9]|uniref:hydroxymethylglutaryl-CoA lyase n=1 Tax=Alicyclobacillus sp. SO9 TaxID=2665646 RepID=UPI0018E82A0C|nr:hydroxymethylglutaryl-CoA lyase [Alicyclobacillus sp. SO9]QQE81224.1 hydroxymethylglutaryl-CoA lyase [Alicyclobacillus sp. SO9]